MRASRAGCPAPPPRPLPGRPRVRPRPRARTATNRPATAQRKASPRGRGARLEQSRLRKALEGRPDRLPADDVTAAPEPVRRRVNADPPARPEAPADPDRADGLRGTAARGPRD